jgi:hypothetical protein
VQLPYKSRDPRPKDTADLAAVSGTLDPVARHWLRTALAVASPGHPWLDEL